MKKLLISLSAISILLSACGGKNEKEEREEADKKFVEAHRAEAQKVLDQMKTAVGSFLDGKLPDCKTPLDTNQKLGDNDLLFYCNDFELEFLKTNAEMPSFKDSIKVRSEDNSIYNAWLVLNGKSTKPSYSQKINIEFLLKRKYIAVAKTTHREFPTATEANRVEKRDVPFNKPMDVHGFDYTPGNYQADVWMFNLDSGKCLGTYKVDASSSGSVSFIKSKNDKRAEYGAVLADLNQRVKESMIKTMTAVFTWN